MKRCLLLLAFAAAACSQQPQQVADNNVAAAAAPAKWTPQQSKEILAKTERDGLMQELDVRYPNYGLGKHKGYGTQAHRSAMQRMGLSEIHRKSFRVK